jgi:type IV pilus assembly protein PilN
MYSLDINFLNDRPEYKPDVAARSRPKAAVSPDSRRALLLGGLAALLLPALAAGSLLFLQNRNAELERQQAELDARLGNLQAKQKEIANIKTQTGQIRDETTALAGIFNQIKPWSAMMQDIRDRVPPGVQIRAVKQLPAPRPGSQPSPSPSPGAPPPNPAAGPPQGPIAITGLANSFNDVNDFMLVLQRSNFLKANETTLVKSELESTARRLETIRLKNAPGGGNQEAPEIPRQVEFEIQTALSDVPASELLRELDRKGAAGLVTRIETLQQKGVIQPQ